MLHLTTGIKFALVVLHIERNSLLKFMLTLTTGERNGFLKCGFRYLDRFWLADILHNVKGYGVAGRIFGFIPILHNKSCNEVVLNERALMWEAGGGQSPLSLNLRCFSSSSITFPMSSVPNKIFFADDTSIYPCFSRKSDKVKLTATLKKDTQSVVK